MTDAESTDYRIRKVAALLQFAVEEFGYLSRYPDEVAKLGAAVPLARAEVFTTSAADLLDGVLRALDGDDNNEGESSPDAGASN